MKFQLRSSDWLMNSRKPSFLGSRRTESLNLSIMLWSFARSPSFTPLTTELKALCSLSATGLAGAKDDFPDKAEKVRPPEMNDLETTESTNRMLLADIL